MDKSIDSIGINNIDFQYKNENMERIFKKYGY